MEDTRHSTGEYGITAVTVEFLFHSERLKLTASPEPVSVSDGTVPEVMSILIVPLSVCAILSSLLLGRRQRRNRSLGLPLHNRPATLIYGSPASLLT